ncbi:YegP family protein [Arthrobacter globiformis]|jgi:uncharacterized protein YegP (UPF0339 family)|uniref:YegP family protein n=1 Tax=Arthrobacter globiformis TaxID=1665 RepID=UPI00167EFE08|nr:hypothetical protein [Arthrobacter globiformis]
MAGYFEIIDAPDGGFRVRLLDATGGLVAVSVNYPTKEAAVAGISWTREVAGTGLIRDMSRGGHGELIIPKSRAAHATVRIHSHTRFPAADHGTAGRGAGVRRARSL